jgi:hypothetical protein
VSHTLPALELSISRQPLYVFYKKHIKYIKKLLNIHIFLIDVWNVRWYNKAYRMTKSQFVFLIELAVR